MRKQIPQAVLMWQRQCLVLYGQRMTWQSPTYYTYPSLSITLVIRTNRGQRYTSKHHLTVKPTSCAECSYKHHPSIYGPLMVEHSNTIVMRLRLRQRV